MKLASFDPGRLEWPTINADDEVLGAKRGEDARRNIRALSMKRQGKSHNAIWKACGLSRQRVHSLMRRALSIHGDGRIHGDRACVPHLRIPVTKEESVAAKEAASQTHGLTRIFGSFPVIEADLKRYLRQDRKSPHERAVRPMHLWLEFLRLCDTHKVDTSGPYFAGAGADKYRTALRRRMQGWLSENWRATADAYFGDAAARKLGSGVHQPQFICAINEVWEVDGHKLDGIFVVLIRLANGKIMRKEIDRIWLLAVRDRGSGVIVAIHIVLRKEYRADDVLLVLEKAIRPAKRREFTLEGLPRPDEAAMPSEAFLEYAWSYPGRIGLDGALANGRHESSRVWSQLIAKVGCAFNPGAHGVPDQRLVENFFALLAAHGFQRTVASTGKSHKDARKRKDAAARAIQYEITPDIGEDLATALTERYNVTESAHSPGFSPIGYLQHCLKDGRHRLLKYVPPEHRERFCLTTMYEHRIAKGPTKKGYRLHINYANVQYSSPKLATAFSLENKEFTIEIDTKDLRTVRAYYNKEFFDTLIAEFGWSLTAHDAGIRRDAFRLVRNSRLKVPPGGDIVRAYHLALELTAPQRKADRNKLADAQRVAKNSPAPQVEKLAQRPQTVRPVYPGGEDVSHPKMRCVTF